MRICVFLLAPPFLSRAIQIVKLLANCKKYYSPIGIIRIATSQNSEAEPRDRTDAHKWYYAPAAIAERSFVALRSFIAVDLPQPLTDKIAHSIDNLKSDRVEDAIRWVRPEALHLTLKFLGEIEQDKANAVSTILENLAATVSRFTIEVGGFGCFPNPKRPRVFWVGLSTQTDELQNLHTDLEIRLETVGFEREHRRFHPHLTVGRAHKGLSSVELRSLSEWFKNAQLGALGSFEVESIKLMRSDLKPSGAIYTSLHAALLKQ